MTSPLTTLSDLDYTNKDIILRVDFNVPLEDGHVTDITRIRAAIPTLKKLQDAGCRIAVFSHMGRPKGKINPEYSLDIVLPILQDLRPESQIDFCDEYTELSREGFWENRPAKSIILCENLRFHPGEEANDPHFAATLAGLGDIYINDAFAACHRSHASITAITDHLPSAAGELLTREIAALSQYYLNAEKPLMAVIGGAKISSKIDVLNALLDKVDILAIGGGMANSFLKALGHEIGNSLYEESALTLASEMMARADAEDKVLLLPTDVIVADKLSSEASIKIKNIDHITAEESIFDIGPETAMLYAEAAEHAKTLLWNGPLGAFEVEPFDQGTLTFASHIVKLTEAQKLVSLTGGGDSVAALVKLSLETGFSYISTGGGAFLEFIEGKSLPGLAVLTKGVPPQDEVNHP